MVLLVAVLSKSQFCFCFHFEPATGLCCTVLAGRSVVAQWRPSAPWRLAARPGRSLDRCCLQCGPPGSPVAPVPAWEALGRAASSPAAVGCPDGVARAGVLRLRPRLAQACADAETAMLPPASRPGRPSRFPTVAPMTPPTSCCAARVCGRVGHLQCARRAEIAARRGPCWSSQTAPLSATAWRPSGAARFGHWMGLTGTSGCAYERGPTARALGPRPPRPRRGHRERGPPV